MLTTTVAGRTWSYSHSIGRTSVAGAGFNHPTAVAVAPGGILYVLSRGFEGPDNIGGVEGENKRIGKLTIDEEFICDFGRQEFTWPAGLAIDNEGNVYCADEYENFVAAYTPDGERIGQWGQSGSQKGELNGPSGLAFDSEDNLYVVDSKNSRVQKFTKDGRALGAWGTWGSGEGQFNQPWGITIDQKGDVYVADFGNDRVQKFTPDGIFLLTFGSADGQGGNLKRPAGVAVDSEGDVYVTDFGNKRVQIYAPEGDIITSLYGDATEFSKWARETVDANPDVGKAYRRVKDMTPLRTFQRPAGIAIDEHNRIIITETTRSRLQVYIKEKDYMEPQFNL